MLSKSVFIRIIRRIYFFLGRRLFKSINGYSFFNKIFLKLNKKVEKKRSLLFVSRIFKSRSKLLRKFIFENPILLFFFTNKSYNNLIIDLFSFKNYYVWNIFNFFVKKIKDIPNIIILKRKLLKGLTLKKNKLIIKFLFFNSLRNRMINNKFEFFSKLVLFLKEKDYFLSSLKNCSNFLKSKEFKKTYFIYILKELKKRKHFLFFNSFKPFMYLKKKRFHFNPLFI